MKITHRLVYIKRPCCVIIAVITIWSFFVSNIILAGERVSFSHGVATGDKLRPLAAGERQRYVLGADPVSVRYKRPFTIVLSVDKDDPPEKMEVAGNVRLQIMHYRDIPDCFLVKLIIDGLIKIGDGNVTEDDYFIIDIDNIAHPIMFKTLRDGEKVIIGRQYPHRFNLPETISRSHVEITRDGDRIIIKDLGSHNGTSKPMFSKEMSGEVAKIAKSNAGQINKYAGAARGPQGIAGIMDKQGRIHALGDQKEAQDWGKALRRGRVFAFGVARLETKDGNAVQYQLITITEFRGHRFPLLALQTLAASLDEAGRMAFVPQEVSPERDRRVAALMMDQLHEILASVITADKVELATALISELTMLIPALKETVLKDMVDHINRIFERVGKKEITREKALNDLAKLLTEKAEFIRHQLAAAAGDLPSVEDDIGKTVVDSGRSAKEALRNILRPRPYADRGGAQTPKAGERTQNDDIAGLIETGRMRVRVTVQAVDDLRSFLGTGVKVFTKDITSLTRLEKRELADGTPAVAVIIRSAVIRDSYTEVILAPSLDCKVVGRKRVVEDREIPFPEAEVKEVSTTGTTRDIIISPSPEITTVITMSTGLEPALVSVKQERTLPLEVYSYGLAGFHPGAAEEDLVRVVYPDQGRFLAIFAHDITLADDFAKAMRDVIDGKLEGWNANLRIEDGQVIAVLEDASSGATQKLPFACIWNRLSELLSDAAITELFGPEYLDNREQITDEAVIARLEERGKIDIKRMDFWEGYATPTFIEKGAIFAKRYDDACKDVHNKGYKQLYVIELHLHVNESENIHLKLADPVLRGPDGTDKQFLLENIADIESIPSLIDLAKWINLVNMYGPGERQQTTIPYEYLSGVLYHRVIWNPVTGLYHAEEDVSIMLYRIPEEIPKQMQWLAPLKRLADIIEKINLGALSREEGIKRAQELSRQFMEVTNRYRVRITPVGTAAKAGLFRLKVNGPEPQLGRITDPGTVMNNILRPLAAGEQHQR